LYCQSRKLGIVVSRATLLADGIGNGLGYAFILVLVGCIRELFGRGSLLGFQLIPESAYHAGYLNNGMMTMPAMALILLGCVIWLHRAYFYKEKK